MFKENLMFSRLMNHIKNTQKISDTIFVFDIDEHDQAVYIIKEENGSIGLNFHHGSGEEQRVPSYYRSCPALSGLLKSALDVLDWSFEVTPENLNEQGEVYFDLVLDCISNSIDGYLQTNTLTHESISIKRDIIIKQKKKSMESVVAYMKRKVDDPIQSLNSTTEFLDGIKNHIDGLI